MYQLHIPVKARPAGIEPATIGLEGRSDSADYGFYLLLWLQPISLELLELP